MRPKRTLPPAAVPIKAQDLLRGLGGVFSGYYSKRKIESELKEHFRVNHVFLVSSGKAALTLILLALKKLSSRNQVLIPAYTCFSVASAIVKAQLQVALCDVDPRSLDFDRSTLKETLNGHTLCVIPTHLFGIPAEMDSLMDLCKGKGIFVVEDVAQAMGGHYRGRQLGTIGDVGFFSLGRGKSITCGSGGIIITNSDYIGHAIAKEFERIPSANWVETLGEFIKLVLMSAVINPRLYWLPAGMRFLKLGQTLFYTDFAIQKLAGMKAGLLYYWKERLYDYNRQRTRTAAYIFERLDMAPVSGKTIPFLRLPILLETPQLRKEAYRIASEMGLGITCMYPGPINEIEEIKECFEGKTFPGARIVAERLLTVPTHPLLSAQDKNRLCRFLRERCLGKKQQ